MQIKKIKLIGGPRDGEVLENNLPFLPDVIDNKSYHLYGPEAYALYEANWDEGYAVFEQMKLVNIPTDS